jgi:hypothetical protein
MLQGNSTKTSQTEGVCLYYRVEAIDRAYES